MKAIRAPWTSASFLLYAGGLAVLFAMLGLLVALGADYDQPAFVGWAAFVFVVLAFLTNGALLARWRLAAGLLGLGATTALVVLVGSLEEWFGWLSDRESTFGGFHVGDLLLELFAVVAFLVALRMLHFPLLVLPAATVAWFFLTDLVSNGGNWSTTVTLVFGLAAMFVAMATDGVYGFWVHVVAGLTVGGALVTFWHTSDTDWILVAIASMAYVFIAARLERSSYAVLAALGLFLATTPFVFKWFVDISFDFFEEEGPTAVHPWAAALSYAVYGFVLMLLGVWLARRRVRADAV